MCCVVFNMCVTVRGVLSVDSFQVKLHALHVHLPDNWHCCHNVLYVATNRFILSFPENPDNIICH